MTVDAGRDVLRPLVAHIVATSTPGGVESFVLSVARRIDRSRFDMAVVATDGEGPIVTELRALGVDTRTIGRHRGVARALLLARALLDLRPTIVHAHVGGRSTRWVVRAIRPRVHIGHVHGIEPALAESLPSPRHPRVYTKRLISGFDRVLVCSSFVRDFVSTAAPQEASGLQLLRYGVDVESPTSGSAREAGSALRQRIGAADTDVVLGFVGRMVEQKGIGELAGILRAVLAMRSDTRALIVGDGPMRGRLDELAGGAFGNRCHLVGWRRDVSAVMNACDILLVPSRWEAFGIVCIEAAAAGKPAVAFGVEGLPEAVEAGVTGLLVPPRDEDAFARAVVRLVDDPVLRARMGAAGQRRVVDQFDERHVARRLENIYTSLLGGSGGFGHGPPHTDP